MPAHPLVAFDNADQHGIHQHIMGGEFARHRFGQSHAGGTRNGSGRGPRQGRLGADIQHIDDAAPFAVPHGRQRQAAKPDGGEKLQVQIILPKRVRYLQEPTALRCAGIIDQDIHLAEALHRRGIGRFTPFRSADIGGDSDHLGARRGGADFGFSLRQALCPTCDNGNMPAGFSEHLRNSQPKPLGPASDQRRAPVQGDIHGSLSPNEGAHPAARRPGRKPEGKGGSWGDQRDSNPRHPRPQPGALPTELWPPSAALK